MSEPLVAQQKMKEFDPECERHFPLLIVKAVDPGCTLEFQIENVPSGRVVRITTTESEEHDMQNMRQALEQFAYALTLFERQERKRRDKENKTK